MKNIFSFILLFFLYQYAQAQFFAPIYSNSVSKNNLIVDYDFQNPTSYSGSGANVASTTGKNIPATLNGSPSFFADPGYVQFKAASANYLMIGDLKTFYPQVTSTTRSGIFSMSIWFNPTGLNGNVVSDLWSSTISDGYHTSDIEMVAGYLKFTVWPRSAVITTAATVSLNAWHHIVLVYTGSKVNAYLDGELVGTATYTREGPAMGSLTTSQYFGIGAYETTNLGSGAYGSFLLGNVKFYATALSTADVNNLYLAEEPNYDLVFMLDAGNTSSYPGSGTSWKDISGAAKSATNSAGATYNAAAAGSIYYNGSSGYTDFSFDLNGASTLTIEMWVFSTSFNAGMFWGFSLFDMWTASGALGFNSAASDQFGLTSTQVANLGLLNNWKHYTFVVNAGSYLNNKIYINGVNQTLSQIQGTQNTSNINFNSGVGRIGCWAFNTSYVQTMYMTSFKIYDRELTQAEITAKFNKTKARHGL
jgi:hypothetical protein